MGVPIWVIVIVGGIVISAFMAVKTGREEREKERELIEKEGEIYMERLEKAKEEKNGEPFIWLISNGSLNRNSLNIKRCSDCFCIKYYFSSDSVFFSASVPSAPSSDCIKPLNSLSLIFTLASFNSF